MKVRNKQVYVAADDSEHATLEDAVKQDVRDFLMQQLHGSHAPRTTVEIIMAGWSTLVTIMDQRRAQAVPVEEDTPQARLAARRERVARQGRQPHTGKCTCVVNTCSKFDVATGCDHCERCGGIVNMDDSAPAQDADFEAENDANEVSRGKRATAYVHDWQRHEKTRDCLDCGAKYHHTRKCRHHPRRSAADIASDAENEE